MSAHFTGTDEEHFAVVIERCKCQEGCKSATFRIYNPRIAEDGSVFCNIPIYGIPSFIKALSQHMEIVFKEIAEAADS